MELTGKLGFPVSARRQALALLLLCLPVTGGEPAAWVIIDAVLRLIPGVLGNFESAIDDSYSDERLLGALVGG